MIGNKLRAACRVRVDASTHERTATMEQLFLQENSREGTLSFAARERSNELHALLLVNGGKTHAWMTFKGLNNTSGKKTENFSV